MPSVNQVNLIGHVTRDPQLKQLPNGNAVAEFGLAMNRKWKTSEGEEREEVCFVDCAIFGKAAEVINQYVTKGKPLYVSGRLKFDTWEDKTGGKRSKLSMIVEQFQFLGSRDDADGEREPVGGQQRSAPKSIAQGVREKRDNRPTPTNPIGDAQEFQDDDIPF